MTFDHREGAFDTGGLFEADWVAPEQFYATLRRYHHDDPERRLMAAVLEDAVACLFVDPSACSRRQEREFMDAKAWVDGSEGGDWVFSFVNVCEGVGIDPSYLRKGLDRWSMQCRARAIQARRARRRRAGM
jgi:hypothetical protein